MVGRFQANGALTLIAAYAAMYGSDVPGRYVRNQGSYGFLLFFICLTEHERKPIIRAFHESAEFRFLRHSGPKGADSEAKVIKLDIVNQVADKTGVPKAKAEVAVEALFEAMKDALQRGERIELRGFGVFVVKPRKRGVGRNPRTGQVTNIPPGKTIRFKPGKELQS